MHLLITGGNGFIGRHICANAVAADHDVTSVARSGSPPDAETADWTDQVEWIAADVFAPHEWRSYLSTVDCVVHSIGTISETLETGVTFERLNGDSAIVAALEADRAGVDRFVYVSSSTKPPLVRDAYMTARRRAEAAIVDLEMDVLIPRFGPVYGPDQPHFPALANYLFTAVGEVEPIARRLGEDRPFSVEMAGQAICELAVTDDPPASPITAETLAALAR
ncbi:NAD-dependent epimerase/dehydratase family protein [Natranaeroarchaeum aerophilus]|uniref:NAD(P)-dependent oxidoreductase n=1 Tax=Natranaeroarchaeum aerophilus TaxID=2917711 RepID=A0AAE3FSL3_9EURY|nr:NAD(P)-dependent oxidoreductase [Natranaeroarchaeum aerophilus]MCL9814568.1 NAD(P)-dependent oxidoreductase [Natranaeroarchaeum aerophilus]